MGSGSWSSDAYSSLKSSYTTKTDSDIFSSSLKKTVDPKGLTFRESRDSAEHPESVAVAVFLDVTGSMSGIPAYLIRNKLNILLETLIEHDIKDAHVLYGAIGDHEYDTYPLQIGQFEAGTDEIVNNLESLVLEKGGGGNAGESYLLAWLTAARYTSIDCFEKRGIKGVLFTIGDEPCLKSVPGSKIRELFGLSETPADCTAEQLLAEAQRMYHVYHIQCSDGRGDYSYEINSWRDLIGERLIVCENKDLVPELIAATVAVVNGMDLDRVAKSFGSKAGVVTTALAKVDFSVTKTESGIVKL